MFLTSNDLNAALDEMLEFAKNRIILISPYIKLHDRFKSILLTKKQDPKLLITLVFGKNEDDLAKSFWKDDFIFLKDFPNIEIRHEKRLHAKFYSNGSESILTSMNLYEYSQNNNIEAGILIKDKDSIEYFNRVIEQAVLLYKKSPKFEVTNFGLTTKYVTSEIEIDVLSSIYNRSINTITAKKEKDITMNMGYCIRTGIRIPFNIEKPMCLDAYKIWNEFANVDYPEKYCHYTGESSNGETNMKSPILKKNWKKAKEQFKL